MNLGLFDTIAMGLLALVVVCVAELMISSMCPQPLDTHFFDLAIVNEVCLLDSVSDETLIGTVIADESYLHVTLFLIVLPTRLNITKGNISANWRVYIIDYHNILSSKMSHLQ